MTFPQFATWFGVMFPIVFSPGPANIVFAASGIRFGFRKSIPLIVGIDLACVVVSLVVGFGLGELLLGAAPNILDWIKYAGTAYTFYLALKFCLPSKPVAEGQEMERAFTFKDGVLLQSFNPKSWTARILMFSLFIDATQPKTTQVLILTGLLCTLSVTSHIVWVFCGSRFANLAKSPRAHAIQRYIFALMLVGTGIWMLLS